MSVEVRTLRGESAQVLPLLLFVLVALLGISALVVDAGYWYREKRSLQTAVDAAAAAGAQRLPDTEVATNVAKTYATANGVSNPQISFSNSQTPNDTIQVNASKSLGGIFGALFDIASVNVASSAAASSRYLTGLKHVIPIAVATDSPVLLCGLACFGQQTTLRLGPDAPGNFGLISFDGNNTDPAQLADWIQNGYSGEMKLDNYKGVTGEKYNSAAVRSALDSRIGTEIYLSVYSQVRGTGDNAVFTIVGWIGFDLSDYDSGSLTGTPRRIIDVGSVGAQSQPEYSAANIALTK